VVPPGLEGLLEAETSLTGSESKVIAALLGLRTASLKQLSEATGICRSNIHGVADLLSAKGLCRRLGGRYSVWECPEPAEVLARLRAAEEERLEVARLGLERTFGEAERMFAASPAATDDPPVSLDDNVRSARLYMETMATLRDAEVLVLNRGPYPGDVEPDPAVLDALARGVRARAIWVSAELDAADERHIRLCADAYAEAGVEQRVVDSLPVAMAVIGESTALLTLPSHDASSAAPVHAVTVRHEGMIELLAGGFERLWDQARPYPAPRPAGADMRVVETEAASDDDA